MPATQHTDQRISLDEHGLPSSIRNFFLRNVLTDRVTSSGVVEHMVEVHLFFVGTPVRVLGGFWTDEELVDVHAFTQDRVPQCIVKHKSSQ